MSVLNLSVLISANFIVTVYPRTDSTTQRMYETEISMAACDDMRDCVMQEIPDRKGCTAVSASSGRAFVRAYTAYPGLTYTPAPCNGTARFFLTNETDPTSENAPHWRAAWTSTFVEQDSVCVLENPPPWDGLVAVFEAYGEFERARDSAESKFELVSAEGVWSSAHAEISIEMDAMYAFPDCCVFPQNFTDSESRLWRQAAHESACDVVDSAEYVHEGLNPTTVSTHNATHDRWRFEVSPSSTDDDACDPLVDPFVVDVYVPLDVVPQNEATPAPRFLLQGVEARDAKLYVFPVVFGMILLVGALFFACVRKVKY